MEQPSATNTDMSVNSANREDAAFLPETSLVDMSLQHAAGASPVSELPPSLRAMLTLPGGDDQSARGGLATRNLPPPVDLLSRLDAFLPQIAHANQHLPPTVDPAGTPGSPGSAVTTDPDIVAGGAAATPSDVVVQRIESECPGADMAAITPRRTRRRTHAAVPAGVGPQATAMALAGEVEDGGLVREADAAMGEVDTQGMDRDGLVQAPVGDVESAQEQRPQGEVREQGEENEAAQRAVEMLLFVDNSLGELVPSHDAPATGTPLIRELDK